MGQQYSYLSYKQRLQIKEMLDDGSSIINIANSLGYHRSSIYKEIERGSIDGKYDPDYAEEKHKSKINTRGTQPICSLYPELASHIADLILNENLSPEQIIIRLQNDQKWPTIPTKTTIYRAIGNGLIPGVTYDDLNSHVTTVFNNGQIHLSKWVRNALGIKDGDELTYEVVENKLVFYKVKK